MNQFSVDFGNITGRIKPMHGVNNGPAAVRGMGNAPCFAEAGIPYARLHDSGFYAGYGGEHSVDVHALFRDFSADENDPASYDFTLTDEYLRRIQAAGTKVFYRLGSKIEHEMKKYGTRVPEDFDKWARVCEHIIRHYNEGWADGLHLGIDYWEIWNEPDCRNADGSNPCWQGTDEQFCDLFYVTLKHLKACFPHLKIGGPAFCYVNEPFTRKLLDRLTQNGERVPLDFYSFHGYACDPAQAAQAPAKARALLDSYGYTGTELIYNEWNYVRRWTPAEEIHYAYRVIKSLKGASFIAAMMCAMQKTPLDLFMYYDARPCSWNGMFDTSTLDPLKGYYPFRMFGELFRLGGEVKSTAQGDLYGCAATGEGRGAVMLTRYADVDEAADEDVRIVLHGLPEGARLRWLLLDADKSMEKVREDRCFSHCLETTIPMKLFDTLLIKWER